MSQLFRAVVFGEGGQDHLRCAYAVSRRDLTEAVKKDRGIYRQAFLISWTNVRKNNGIA